MSTPADGAPAPAADPSTPTGVAPNTVVINGPVPAAEPPAATPPVVAQPGVQGTPGPDGLPDDPAVLRAEIDKLRRENGAARTTAKANAAEQARNEFAQTIGKALGLIKEDEPVDPAKLAEQLSQEAGKASAAQRELAVFRNAVTAGGDPSILLNWTPFTESIKSVDPSDDNAISEAIKAAVASNPMLGLAPGKRTPMPNPAMGASANGAPDLEALIAEAQKRGDIATVIHLQNQKLAAPQR